jgi:PAS domain-containing protein
MDVTDNCSDSELAPEHLALVLDIGHMGRFSLNLVTNEVKRSQIWYELFGGSALDPAEESYSKWLNVLHPADRKKMLALSASLSTSAVDSVISEYRVITLDRKLIWLREYARIVERDATGNPIFIAGVYMDITEEKRIVHER